MSDVEFGIFLIIPYWPLATVSQSSFTGFIVRNSPWDTATSLGKLLLNSIDSDLSSKCPFMTDPAMFSALCKKEGRLIIKITGSMEKKNADFRDSSQTCTARNLNGRGVICILMRHLKSFFWIGHIWNPWSRSSRSPPIVCYFVSVLGFAAIRSSVTLEKKECRGLENGRWSSLNSNAVTLW